jgi:sugar phosphate isomerase/epimerase
MDQNRLGIGSFAYRYHVGIAACMPPIPMTPIDFINAVAQLGLKRIQLCENLKYADYSKSVITAMGNRARDLGLIVELGMNGLTRDNLYKHIDLAYAFDSKFIRIVIGNLDCNEAHAIKIAAENLRSILNECRTAGIQIGLENHFDLKTEQIVNILEEVGDPLVGGVFDSTNAINFLERPLETLSLLLPYIKSVHLKDFRMIKTEAGIELAGQILGQGILNTKSILKEVISKNPKASIILELTIRRRAGLSIEEILQEETVQIMQSVEYAKMLCSNY